MKLLMRAATAALILVLPAPARAQTGEKKTLTLEGAKKVAAAAEAFAKQNGAGGVLAIVDDGGNLMYLQRLDETFPAGARVSIGKARTAALFKKPTGSFEKLINEGRTVMVALEDFTPLRGGVPIVVDGQVVGAIGVSGAKSAAQDEEMASAGANALSIPAPAGGGSARGAQPSKSANFMAKDAVAAAFAKGAPLFENDEFKVHASRRETAGQAEVHVRDTDILYVLEGSATLVTGGAVVDGKQVAPDEIRGREIAGGEARTIGKGDVVIVPAGVPHWFKEVKGPVTYYVVKVTRDARTSS
jgi:glc operon protein GlcG